MYIVYNYINAHIILLDTQLKKDARVHYINSNQQPARPSEESSFKMKLIDFGNATFIGALAATFHVDCRPNWTTPISILRMEEILRHLGWLKPYIINNGINHLSTDAGFLPSTVGYCFTGAEFTVPRLPQPLLIGS